MIIFNRTTEASLNSAKRKYVLGQSNGTMNRITSAAFDYLATLDPTPTKKYLETICKWFLDPEKYLHTPTDELYDPRYYKKEKDLVLHFINARTMWLLGLISKEKVGDISALFNMVYEYSGIAYFKEIINQYFDLETRYANTKWIIKSLYFPDFWNLIKFVERGHKLAEGAERIKSVEPPVRRLLRTTPPGKDYKIEVDTEKALVVSIRSYKFSEELGSVTIPKNPWCIMRGTEHWGRYRNQEDSIFYYFLDRRTADQWCIQRNVNNGGFIAIWDSGDKRHGESVFIDLMIECGFSLSDLEMFVSETGALYCFGINWRSLGKNSFKIFGGDWANNMSKIVWDIDMWRFVSHRGLNGYLAGYSLPVSDVGIVSPSGDRFRNIQLRFLSDDEIERGDSGYELNDTLIHIVNGGLNKDQLELVYLKINRIISDYLYPKLRKEKVSFFVNTPSLIRYLKDVFDFSDEYCYLTDFTENKDFVSDIGADLNEFFPGIKLEFVPAEKLLFKGDVESLFCLSISREYFYCSETSGVKEKWDLFWSLIGPAVLFRVFKDDSESIIPPKGLGKMFENTLTAIINTSARDNLLKDYKDFLKSK